MPAWIHQRAERLMPKMKEQYGEEKGKQVAFAVATQMGHATGKSPKTFVSKETGHKERFGTPEGRHEAKAKFDKPKSEYKKTAGAVMFGGFTDEMLKIAQKANLVAVRPKTGPENYRPMEWHKKPYSALPEGAPTEEYLRRKGKFSPFSVTSQEASYKPPGALKSKLTTAMESAGARAGAKVGPSSRLLKILGKIR